MSKHTTAGAVQSLMFFTTTSSLKVYMITFRLEEEKVPLFGKSYQLKLSGHNVFEDHCLVHFPSLIRLAREASLGYVMIQNITDSYDVNRAQIASLLMNAGPNLVDPRGKLIPRALDMFEIYATVIFQKPDPDPEPPLTTPIPF